MTVCRLCVVSGRVQGVFFRATTRDQAQRVGLTGHARNLPDGRVEVLVCGPQVRVEEFCTWLWQGSPLAEVTAVECQPSELPPPTRFTTGQDRGKTGTSDE